MLISVAPVKDVIIIMCWMLIRTSGHMVIIRRSPYAPSFKRTPARIIDPATGASTWALGNHE